jgi:hypothetical protein
VSVGGAFRLGRLGPRWCHGAADERQHLLTNDWGIPSDPSADRDLQDARDATAIHDTMEREVIPMFYDRDEQGVPHDRCQCMEALSDHQGPEVQRHEDDAGLPERSRRGPPGVRDRMTVTGIRAEPHSPSAGRLPSRTA